MEKLHFICHCGESAFYDDLATDILEKLSKMFNSKIDELPTLIWMEELQEAATKYPTELDVELLEEIYELLSWNDIDTYFVEAKFVKDFFDNKRLMIDIYSEARLLNYDEVLVDPDTGEWYCSPECAGSTEKIKELLNKNYNSYNFSIGMNKHYCYVVIHKDKKYRTVVLRNDENFYNLLKILNS